MRKSFLVCFLFLVLAGCAASAQVADPQFRRHRNQESDEARREREQLKKLNKERHAKIRQDADKLLQLATELKQYVDKTNENVLSVEVIRKSEEIEKLAHDVRERTKQDYTPPAWVLPH